MPSKKRNPSGIKTIYVSDLAEGVQKDELVAVCKTYGRVENIWVAPASPRFAIVEFEKAEDAADIVYDLHGEVFCGRKLSVELYDKPITSRYPASPPKDSREAKRAKKSKRERRTPIQYRKRRPPISPSSSVKSSDDEAPKSPLEQSKTRSLKRSSSLSERSGSRRFSPPAKRIKHVASPGYERKPDVRRRSRSRSRKNREYSPEAKEYRSKRMSPECSRRSRSVVRPRAFQQSPTRRYASRPPSPPPYRAERKSPDYSELRRRKSPEYNEPRRRKSPDYNEPRRRVAGSRSRSPPSRDYHRERNDVYSPIERRPGASSYRGGPSGGRYQSQPFSRRGRPASRSPVGRTPFPSSSRRYDEPYQRAGQGYKGTKPYESPSFNSRRDAGSAAGWSRNDDFSDKRRISPDGVDLEEAAKILATTICMEEDWDLDEPKKVDSPRQAYPKRSKDDWNSQADPRTKPKRGIDDWNSQTDPRTKSNSKKSFAADKDDDWDTMDTKPKSHSPNWNSERPTNGKSQSNPFNSKRQNADDWSNPSSKPAELSKQRGTTPDDGDWDSPPAPTQSYVETGRRTPCSPEEKINSMALKSSKPPASKVEELDDVSDEDSMDVSKHERRPKSPAEEDWGSQPSIAKSARKNRGMTPDDGDWDEPESVTKPTMAIRSPSKDRESRYATNSWEDKNHSTKRVSRESTKSRVSNIDERAYQPRKDRHNEANEPTRPVRPATPLADSHEDDWSIANSSRQGASSKLRGVTPDEGDWD